MPSRRSCGSALIIALLVGCGDSTSPPEQELSFTTPIRGAPMVDVFYGAYVDHATGSAIQDYMCGAKSYDGHRGVDILLRNFQEQDAGVPVIAAAAGEVESVVDRYADRNTTWDNGGGLGNHVVLVHSGGLRTIYGHLRRGSVRFYHGQWVLRGEILGMVGSSGTSNWPHLHFEVHRNGVPVDPFAGGCASSQSMWSAQLAYQDGFMVTDAGLLNEGPTYATLLERPPTVGSFPLDADYLWFWLQLANQKAAVMRFEFRNPSGETVVDVSGSVGPAFSMRYLVLSPPVLGLLEEAGDWEIRTYQDDQLVWTEPFTLFPAESPPVAAAYSRSRADGAAVPGIALEVLDQVPVSAAAPR